MDLATVKAKVKSWEKAFRAEHAREPTKDDIRKDASDIGGLSSRTGPDRAAELYATYRKLSKATSKDNAKPRRNADVVDKPKNNYVTPSKPRTRPSLQTSPTTPTPRRLFGNPEAGPSKRSAPQVTPGRDQKRQKSGYTGPVHDPNPFRTPQKAALPAASPFSAKVDAESQFIHAGSPRRLREVLEANSLKKSRERDETPRTKARKRLAGEMDDSPFRVRKRRGEGKKATAEDKENGLDLEPEGDDDEIGETPIKGAAFGLLDDSTSKPRDLLPIFQKARTVPTVVKSTPRKHSSSPPPPDRRLVSPTPEVSAPDDDLGPTPQPDSPARSVSTPSVANRSRGRVVVLGEEDEWDPESDKRVVKITGTRRPTVRGPWSDDEFNDQPDSPYAAEEDAEEGWDDDDGLAETRSLASLSLRSPAMRKGEKLADLRVRALLDPTSAAATALKAMNRGQDVYVSGEGVVGGDEEDIEGIIEIGEGDDDWESDPEGWKAVVSEEEW